MAAFFLLFLCLLGLGEGPVVDPLYGQIETSQSGRWGSCHWPSVLVALWICPDPRANHSFPEQVPSCCSQKTPTLPSHMGSGKWPRCAFRWCLCHLPPPIISSSDLMYHAVPCLRLNWGHFLRDADERLLLSWFRSFMVPHTWRMKSQDLEFRISNKRWSPAAICPSTSPTVCLIYHWVPYVEFLLQITDTHNTHTRTHTWFTSPGHDHCLTCSPWHSLKDSSC